MGFSVTEKGIGYNGGYIYKKSSGAGGNESASTKSYFQKLHDSNSVKHISTGQTSAMELYERMRRFQAITEEEAPVTDAPAEGTDQTVETIAEKAKSESDSTRNDGQAEEDSKTDTEIIMKPDGSRVLVVTMNVGGIETSMTLEISKPTAMPNGIRTEGEACPEQAENHMEILDSLEKK